MMQMQPEILSREEILGKFRLDTGGGVEWRKWEPGGEYTKKLHITNVDTTTQHIKYVLPTTKYFMMDFPETIVLSPGMGCAINVTFRPIESHPYHDYVWIKILDRGEFAVPIVAVIPSINAQVQSDLDFGACPANEQQEMSFALTNTGELDFSYEWKLDPPFKIINPNTFGHIAYRKKQTFTVAFSPTEAGVWNAVAVCKIQYNGSDGGLPSSCMYKVVNIKGIAKYPFITNSVPNIQFGEVLVGKTSEKEFHIRNLSTVETSFKIVRTEPLSSLEPSIFALATMSGKIPAKGSVPVQVLYSPTSSGVYSSQTFEILTPGGNKTSISLCGTAIGAKIALSTNSINFGNIEAGKTATKILTVYNLSKDVAVFQITTEFASLFSFDLKHSEAKVNANSSIEIKIKFTPTIPINYYKRVYFLVQNEHPHYLDLLGTCYSSQQRPPEFFQRHVEATIKRRKLGLTTLPPEKLETISLPDDITENLSESERLERLYDEFFGLDRENIKEVEIRESAVDFGPCSRLRPAETRSIHVTNYTQGKVTANWIMPGGSRAVFFVSPQIVDINPNETYQFRVSFQPDYDNQFYGQILECFVNYKTMRNFRLVSEKGITAPWCLSVYAAGHTFPPGGETFLPQADFQVKRLVFPACHIKTSVYQTITLTNSGDTPVQFNMEQEVGKLKHFVFKPSRGTLQPNYNQLIVFKFSPQEVGTVRENVQCILNNSVANAHELLLIGHGESPKITLENNGELYLKPTCLGAATRRAYTIHNPSKIPVSYKLLVPNKYENTFFFEPMNGILRPNERVNLDCTFIPDQIKRYSAKIRLVVSGTDEEKIEISADIRIFAEGTGAYVTLSPQLISFESVLIGSAKTKELTICNHSNCNIFFKLDFETEAVRDTLQFNDSGLDLSHDHTLFAGEPVSSDPLFEINPTTGSIPANNTQRVTLTFAPRQHNFYTFNIRCLLTLDPLVQQRSEFKCIPAYELPYIPTCEVVGVGVYPSICITDIRKYGTSARILWNQFQIAQLNEELLRDLTPLEQNLNKYKGLFKNNELVPALPYYPFNFGAAPVSSPPTNIYLFLENTGAVTAQWSFTFLAKSEVSYESWVEIEEQTEAEKAQQTIVDNKIFSITPECGTLEPGESTQVKFSYRHMAVATHTTNVLFQVHNGKPLKLSLEGITLSSGEKYIRLEKVHYFYPIPVGTITPLLQSLEVYNESSSELTYEIETEALKKFAADNYEFPVLECLNPTGTAKPGSCIRIKWLFTPIEEKVYDVDIPIRVIGGAQAITQWINYPPIGDTTTVRLIGRGYDPQKKMFEELGYSEHVPSFPTVQIHALPGQLALLSSELLNFGKVPTHSVNSRILTVSNTSFVVISFAWETVDSHVLSVSPSKGSLNPGESVLCKVTLSAPEAAELHLFDLACKFVNEAEKRKQDALKVEPDEEQVDFIITSTTGKIETLEREEEDDMSTARSLSSRTSRKSALNTGKFKKSIPKKRAKLPLEDTLFVTIQATVISENQYKLEFNDSSKFFVPIHSKPHDHSPAKGNKQISTPTANTKEAIAKDKKLFQEILEEMLKDIVRGPEIQLTTNEMESEPSPLFAQMVQCPNHPVEEEIPEYLVKQKKLFENDELKELVQEVLEGTLFNLMIEAQCGEFNILVKPTMISDGEALLRFNKSGETGQSKQSSRNVTFAET